MKTTFFYLATLAAGAFAAPAVNAPRADDGVSGVNDAVGTVDGIVSQDLGIGQLIDAITKSGTPFKRDVKTSGDVINVLTGAVDSVKGNTGSINSTLAKVQDGSMTKDDATKDIAQELKDMHFKLTDILTELLGAGGLNVADGDVDKVLNLVVILLSEVLATVKSLLTILGIRPQLALLLHSLFNIVAGLLKALISLLAGLLPGLVAALSPLLAGLGNGLLVPLLTPIVALLAGISAPGQ